MASTFKTPGVYVQEVSNFPPSVAPVETAIPAFIGYTEKAEKNGEDLTNVPTRVDSFVEFVQYFGGAPGRNVIIRLNASNQFVAAEAQGDTFLLYDALRLFYDNGGGDCYIVSVGDYSGAANIGDINLGTGILGGLKMLEKYDEPTILVSPDATLVGNSMYTYQQQALKQCAKLQDRFLVGDLLKNDEDAANETFDDRVTQVRDNIGINNLKYGAIYAPWIKATIPVGLNYRDVLFARVGDLIANIDGDSSRAILFGMTSDNALRQLIFDLENATNTAIAIESQIDPNNGSGLLSLANTLAGELKALADAYTAIITAFDEIDGDTWTDLMPSLPDFYSKFIDILVALQTVVGDLPTLVANIVSPNANESIDFRLSEDIDDLQAAMQTVFDQLCTHHVEIDGASANALALFDAPSADFTAALSLLDYDPLFTQPSDLSVDADIQAAYAAAALTATPIRSALELAGNAAIQSITSFASYFADVLSAAQSYEATFNESLKSAFGTYKTLLSRSEQELMVLPPSAAIAGIYAAVDNARGVWKAPANVSLSSVSGPYVVISSSEQESLNVDVNAGKSINAIRSFTGKGTLVWGARTLAGNDNEWRYVSVRRFFNFAEESIKKATESFVFEPNDANTWVKVKAMIENFLTLQWRAGALAGAKPDQAFFVKVGLGQTMTALDILEGRMIVEIGMAVVRPAEFIILRFSHKMQES